MNRYEWRQIETVPGNPGVYAWYFTPKLSSKDITALIDEVNRCKLGLDEAGGTAAVENFLRESIFRYFAEQPYEAMITGPLKPRYEGTLTHHASLSPTLVSRIFERPERLNTIKRILETSVPDFASPIYIGMSKNLGQRLARHKALIERYRGTPGLTFVPSDLNEEDKRDHSFAWEISSRGIPPNLLSVFVEAISADEGAWVDVENILNRIHFPLLGRN